MFGSMVGINLRPLRLGEEKKEEERKKKQDENIMVTKHCAFSAQRKHCRRYSFWTGRRRPSAWGWRLPASPPTPPYGSSTWFLSIAHVGCNNIDLLSYLPTATFLFKRYRNTTYADVAILLQTYRPSSIIMVCRSITVVGLSQ